MPSDPHTPRIELVDVALPGSIRHIRRSPAPDGTRRELQMALARPRVGPPSIALQMQRFDDAGVARGASAVVFIAAYESHELLDLLLEQTEIMREDALLVRAAVASVTRPSRVRAPAIARPSPTSDDDVADQPSADPDLPPVAESPRTAPRGAVVARRPSLHVAHLHVRAAGGRR